MKDKIKLMVINNSYQICKFIDNGWVVCDVMPENGVPRGIYYLEKSKKADISRSIKYKGVVLYLSVKNRLLYQLVDKDVIVHPAGEHTKGIVVGQFVELTYN